MIYIKKFNNDTERSNYLKSNFVSPHLFMNAQNRNVNYFPKYKRLDYISSTKTGGQYIDLGCKLLENTDDIRIDIKFNIKNHGKDGNQQSTLIASQPEVSPYPGFTMRIAAIDINDIVQNVSFMTKWMCSENWGSYNDGKTRYCCSYMSPISSKTYEPVIEGGTVTYANQIYEYSILLDNIPNDQINNFSCHLFCALNSSNNPFRFVEADLYYLKFTKGEQVIRNLIPVKKVSTNEIGLYDMENDHLYVSQGDQPFVAGSIIE